MHDPVFRRQTVHTWCRQYLSAAAVNRAQHCRSALANTEIYKGRFGDNTGMKLTVHGYLGLFHYRSVTHRAVAIAIALLLQRTSSAISMAGRCLVIGLWFRIIASHDAYPYLWIRNFEIGASGLHFRQWRATAAGENQSYTSKRVSPPAVSCVYINKTIHRFQHICFTVC